MEQVTIRGETFFLLPEKELRTLALEVNSFLTQINTPQVDVGERQLFKAKTSKVYHIGLASNQVECGVSSKSGLLPEGKIVKMEVMDTWSSTQSRLCSNCRWQARELFHEENLTVTIV